MRNKRFMVKRIDLEDNSRTYLTPNREWGTKYEAEIFDSWEDAEAAMEEDVYGDTGDYDIRVIYSTI